MEVNEWKRSWAQGYSASDGLYSFCLRRSDFRVSRWVERKCSIYWAVILSSRRHRELPVDPSSGMEVSCLRGSLWSVAASLSDFLVRQVTADGILSSQGTPPGAGSTYCVITPAAAFGCGVCALFHSIRLETRTKEFNMCASHWVFVNLEAK